jgi:phage terminase large subunit-like protein
MTDNDKLKKLILERDRRINQNRLKYAFPDETINMLNGETIWKRELYKKHLSFFAAGAEYFERAFIAGNRVGKTRSGVYEVLVHATGLYPDWWVGKRFKTPVNIWIAGDRGEAIRDSIQPLLMSFLPKDLLIKSSSMAGVANAIGQYYIKHASGGQSAITVKTYQSGRTAFEAAAVHVVMLDEECPFDIYVECLMRTATTKGIVFLTFTPDSGVTETVMHYLNSTPEDHRFFVMAGWDDIPHMSEEEKIDRIKSIPPHMRDCRTKGIPYLGSGAVYPVPETDFLVDAFEIPDWWPRAFALDVGWGGASGTGKTACIWGAWDHENGVMYVYSEYKRGQTEPLIHAEAIKSRGSWIPGVIDTASSGSSSIDGRNLREMYSSMGLLLFNANKSVEAGIFKVFQGLSTGQIKIFRTCVQLLEEMRIYRRNDKGQIANNQTDDLCDSLRYLVMSAQGISQTKPTGTENLWESDYNPDGKSPITGY